jgi:hypothetical protein
MQPVTSWPHLLYVRDWRRPRFAPRVVLSMVVVVETSKLTMHGTFGKKTATDLSLSLSSPRFMGGPKTMA